MTMLRSAAFVCVYLLQVVFCFNLTYIGPPSARNANPGIKNGDAFLVRFGFHILAPGENLASITSEQRADALRKFQERLGLPQTGLLDDLTREKMARPRCGSPDMEDLNPNMNHTSQKSRYVLAEGDLKWSRPFELKYYIVNFTPDLPQSIIVQAIKDAWSYWETVANIKAIRVMDPSQARLKISFSSGQHGDGAYAAFDGANGVLAHAYFPEDGRIHFDEDETFTEGPENNQWGSYNFRIVAAHEFGHALGLDHSYDEEALMAPYYAGYLPRDRCLLGQDDINGIRVLYGKGGTGAAGRCGPSVAAAGGSAGGSGGPGPGPGPNPQPEVTTTPAPRALPSINLPAGAPNPCNMPIDAMWMGLDSHFYVVRGAWLFRVKNDGEVVEIKRSRRQFARFPNRPDAAAYSSRTRKLFVFKDTRVWMYSDRGQFLNMLRARSPSFPGKRRGTPKSAFTDANGQIKIIFGTDIYDFDEDNIDRTRKTGSTDLYNLRGKKFDAAAADEPSAGSEQYFYLIRGRYYRKIDTRTMKVVDSYKSGKGRKVAGAFFGCKGYVVPKK